LDDSFDSPYGPVVGAAPRAFLAIAVGPASVRRLLTASSTEAEDMSTRGKRNKASAHLRDGPTELSVDDLRGVTGGLQGASRAPSTPAPPASKPAKPSMVGQVVNGITVKKDWVASDGQVHWGGRGQVVGAKAVALHAADAQRSQQFNSAMSKIGNALGEVTGISGLVNGIRDHNVGEAFLGAVSVASNFLPGVGTIAGKIGGVAGRAIETAATQAGKAAGKADRVGSAINKATGGGNQNSNQ
jgi:hypothetical protein